MTTWWKEAVFYEIYMPSFCDGNGDGIGDFKGVRDKLDYLAELGVGGIWLTPFYRSPKVDNGYDIADYCEIDPDYGTMADFERFLEEAHRRNIKVIADLVLNHTSTEHPWFQESKSAKASPKRDWYIWRDEPNNWESFFGGSAWEYDEATKQYYYHAFAKEQADLNWSNPEVRAAMFDVMKFWLEKGIDGFRLDVINFLTVNDSFPDNPFDRKTGEQLHVYDKDQEGILARIEEMAAFVHQYPGKFLVGEVGSEDLRILKRYCGEGRLDVVFNFNLGSMKEFDIEGIYKQLAEMEKEYTAGQLPTLFFSSHDMPRHISRFGGGEERAKMMAALMLTAKGVPFIYYGDEIGMRDWKAKHISDMKDVQGVTAYRLARESGKSEDEALAAANEKSRDASRTPMQWDESEYAGFSTVEPWIQLPEEHAGLTVEKQRNNPESMLSFYRELVKLRKAQPALMLGSYEFLKRENGVVYFVRAAEDNRVLVLLNFGDTGWKCNIGQFGPACSLLLSNRRKIIPAGETMSVLPNEALIMKLEGGETIVGSDKE